LTASVYIVRRYFFRLSLKKRIIDLMFRIFTEPHNISAGSIRLSEEDSGHIRSMRLRPDENFIVCDGCGTDYVCKLGRRCDFSVAEIVEKKQSSGEPAIKCRVFAAYSKGDRLDYIVQKSVELGAFEIVLFESERCVAVPHDIPKKTARLQRISLETAKQCNRGIIPGVTSCGTFDKAVCEAAEKSGLTLLFYEDEDQLHLKKVLDQHEAESISIITGPEGGFEAHEVSLARSENIHIVSLGPRVLRSETAPVAALAVIMYQTGNM